MDIQTTRAGSGDMATRTTGGPAAGGLPLNQLFSALIQKRLQAPKAQSPAPMRASAPRMNAAAAAPAPSMGSTNPNATIPGGSRSDVVTRMVKDPRQSPFFKMGTGLDHPTIIEKGYKDKNGNIQWEFDTERPSGSSGGIIGGGAESSLHPTSNLQAKMPAYATGDPNVPPDELEDPQVNRAQAGGALLNATRSRAPIAPRRLTADASGINAGRAALASAIRGGRL